MYFNIKKKHNPHLNMEIVQKLLKNKNVYKHRKQVHKCKN